MKEDLTQIRFYISKHYKQLVEDPSNRRQELFHYNYIQKCKQSEKLEKRIQKLEEELLLKSGPFDSASPSKSGDKKLSTG